MRPRVPEAKANAALQNTLLFWEDVRRFNGVDHCRGFGPKTRQKIARLGCIIF